MGRKTAVVWETVAGWRGQVGGQGRAGNLRFFENAADKFLVTAHFFVHVIHTIFENVTGSPSVLLNSFVDLFLFNQWQNILPLGVNRQLV
jgi:hypothetical protein